MDSSYSTQANTLMTKVQLQTVVTHDTFDLGQQQAHVQFTSRWLAAWAP